MNTFIVARCSNFLFIKFTMMEKKIKKYLYNSKRFRYVIKTKKEHVKI